MIHEWIDLRKLTAILRADERQWSVTYPDPSKPVPDDFEVRIETMGTPVMQATVRRDHVTVDTASAALGLVAAQRLVGYVLESMQREECSPTLARTAADAATKQEGTG